jgi:hypothetical protein
MLLAGDAGLKGRRVPLSASHPPVVRSVAGPSKPRSRFARDGAQRWRKNAYGSKCSGNPAKNAELSSSNTPHHVKIREIGTGIVTKWNRITSD